MDTRNALIGVPKVYHPEDLKVMESAYHSILKIFNEYAKTHNLTEAQKNSFHHLLFETYSERKMRHFLKPRLQEISKRIEFSINTALSQTDLNKEEPDNRFFTEVLYFKKNKSIVSNEPF